MTPSDPTDRRRVLALLAWGAALAVSPLGIGGPAPFARADEGDDHSGSGGGGDDHGGDDGDSGGDHDSSGPGGGDSGNDGPSGGGRDSDGRDDSGGGQDDGGSGSGDRDGQGDSGSRSRSGSGSGSDDQDGGSGPGRIRDITVYYPDGWVERILGGRYELIDQQRRLVVRRRATSEDYDRMIALR